MRIEHDLKLDFKDVLIRPKRSTLKSRSDVDLLRTFRFKHAQIEWTGIPIIAANMDHTGTFAMANVLSRYKLLTAISKFATLKAWEKAKSEMPQVMPACFVSAGVAPQDIDYVKKVLQIVDTPFICLDIANGYSQVFVDFVKQVRENFPGKIIAAGNVVTGEMVEELVIAGADIVKIGIGPGSVCTTRMKTGVGYPQLSAIIECADAAHGLKGHVCSDGGCVVAGDVAKAFAAGADFVMLGKMFAGHDESSGEVIEIEGQRQR